MIGAVVLSAGASSRMGSPKALLKIGDETFLQHVVGVLCSAGIRDIVIVLGANADQVRESLSWFAGTTAVNEEWEQGQLTSIVCGLRAFPPEGLEGVLICPVDRPCITPRLINQLLEAFENSKEMIVVPVYHGRRGHPAVFPRSRFEELASAPIDVGARHILHENPGHVCEVITDEEGAILNIDTREDYQAHFALPHRE